MKFGKRYKVRARLRKIEHYDYPDHFHDVFPDLPDPKCKHYQMVKRIWTAFAFKKPEKCIYLGIRYIRNSQTFYGCNEQLENQFIKGDQEAGFKVYLMVRKSTENPFYVLPEDVIEK